MRIFKKCKFLYFILVVCLVNEIMSFLIEPAKGASDMMWSSYYKQKEIDTIFIGSSLCSATFDPKVFEDKLGVKAFNMGTPMQALSQNASALETALEEHAIDTVIIGMGFFVLQEEVYEVAELTFEKELARNSGGIKGYLKSMKYVLSETVRDSEKSINYWFPWVYNAESYSLESIKKNVNSKIKIMQSDESEETDNKGYAPYTGVVDYSTASEKNSYLTYKQELQEELLEKFEKLLIICKKENVDVIVVNTPHPEFDILACIDTYAQNEEKVKDLCKKYEVDYYNFSLAKPELFEAKKDFFYDYEHLNYEGSQAFCTIFCEFLQMRNKNENLDKHFYDIEDYIENIRGK